MSSTMNADEARTVMSTMLAKVVDLANDYRQQYGEPGYGVAMSERMFEVAIEACLVLGYLDEEASVTKDIIIAGYTVTASKTMAGSAMVMFPKEVYVGPPSNNDVNPNVN